MIYSVFTIQCYEIYLPKFAEYLYPQEIKIIEKY